MTLKTFFGHHIDWDMSAQMWTLHHLVLSLFAVLSILLTIKLSERIKNSTREKKIKYTFLGILIFLEISYHIHNWTFPRFSVPLHVCSFAVMLLIALLITDSKKVWNYAFFYGTIGGIMALIIPNSLGYSYYNFRYYHFIVIHSVILSVPIYYYIAYDYRIDYKTTINVFRNSVILGIIVYILNGLFHMFGNYFDLGDFMDTNYWFIYEIPEHVSSVFTNWNVYIICFIALVFITMNTLYLVSNYKTLFSKRTKK